MWLLFLVILIATILFLAILWGAFYRAKRYSMDVVKYIEYSYRDTDDQ